MEILIVKIAIIWLAISFACAIIGLWLHERFWPSFAFPMVIVLFLLNAVWSKLTRIFDTLGPKHKVKPKRWWENF